MDRAQTCADIPRKTGSIVPGDSEQIETNKQNEKKKQTKNEESARIRPFFGGFRFDNRPDNLPRALKRAKDEGSYLL